MDTFMEKLVTRKKTLTDHLITIGAVVGSALLILLALSIPILIQLGLSIVLAAAAAYLGYRVITSRISNMNI